MTTLNRLFRTIHDRLVIRHEPSLPEGELEARLEEAREAGRGGDATMTDEQIGQLEDGTDRIPRNGHLVRTEDESGVSGEGYVAEFTEFTDGRVVISWWNDANENLNTEGNGLAVYDSLDDARQVHGHSGRTEFRYVDTEAGR